MGQPAGRHATIGGLDRKSGQQFVLHQTILNADGLAFDRGPFLIGV